MQSDTILAKLATVCLKETDRRLCILSRCKFVFIISLVLALLLQPSALWALPSLQENRSKATRLEKEIDAYDEKNEIAVEQFNQAQIKLGNIRQELSATRAKLESAEKELAVNQEILNTRVANIYKAGEAIDILELLLSARSIADLIAAVESLEFVSDNDAKIVSRTKILRRKVEQSGRALATQESEQASVTAYQQAKKNQIISQLSQRKKALEKVINEIGRAETAAAEARLASIGRARAVAPTSNRVSTPAPVKIVDVPASGKGAAVVRLAMAELGKPYVWAAAGPNSFDCSGLTMYVYAQVGISLPHSADAQFRMGRQVNKANLQPGDLIFGGSQGYVSHVGIYIGGGNYINAPQTGDVVKVSSLASRRNYVGATRP